jgi:histidinol-phosphatase (PHP family)
VHTQFSWDAPRGDMEATCRKAIDIGLPAIAFTDHADYVQGVHAGMHRLDIHAYHREVERCRTLFPGLRILSGVEVGEAHRFPAETGALLAAGPLDRVLGSVHCFTWAGELMDGSQLGRLTVGETPAALRAYFDELLALVRSSQPFAVLAHLDYPKRYWPHAELPYCEDEYEEEIRAVLRGAAARGSVLELNTTRGVEPHRGLCPGRPVLGWWVEEGGRAVSMGSDAHDPERIARGFELAGELAEAAGFQPNDDPADYWRR